MTDTDGGPAFPSVSKREEQVLRALAGCDSEDFGYMSFDGIAQISKLARRHVRRTVRALARKGLTEYCRGLWTEDGTPAGSGYRCTQFGRDMLAARAPKDKQP